MSRIVKGNAAGISPWGARPDSPPPPPVIDPEVLALRAEQQRLEHRLKQQDAELAELRAQLRSAYEDGEASGRDAGRREATDAEAQRLARLEAGIGEAREAFERALRGLERLAPALAHDALAAILGPSDDHVPLVVATVRHQLAAIEAGAVVQVEVSAADFADDLALETLEKALGPQAPVIHASVALKSGDCRIKLKLGTLEVGPCQQWDRLGAPLREMAEPAGERA